MSGFSPGESPRYGEIYMIEWSPGRGSEQQGRRPGLVVSPDRWNRVMRTAVTVALTSTVKPATRAGRNPVAVYLPAGDPLPREGSVLAFQVMTTETNRFEDYMGDLTDAQMTAVAAAMRAALSL